MHLPETQITSGCLADIGKLRKLGVLTLANNNISGGYGALASCKMLAWIELSGIQISDQDVEDLMTIPKLSRLSLTVGAVSEAGKSKLRAKGIAIDELPVEPTTQEEPAGDEKLTSE